MIVSVQMVVNMGNKCLHSTAGATTPHPTAGASLGASVNIFITQREELPPSVRAVSVVSPECTPRPTLASQ